MTPDEVIDRLDRAIEHGEMTDQEAREAYLDAQEQAEMEQMEAWRYGYRPLRRG